MKTEYEKCMAGEPFIGSRDPKIVEMILRTKRLLAQFNATDYADSKRRRELLCEMLGHVGKNVHVDIDFHCECGKHIFMGDKVIVNMNCTFVDNNRIDIGSNVLIASNVQIYTATHSTKVDERMVQDCPEGQEICRTYSRIKGSVFGVVAGSALIAAGASGVFTYLLPALFPAYYKEQNWTLGKHVLNLLLMLLLIAVGIWAYQSWLMGMWLDKRLFFLALSWVMVLAPFPTIFFLMWNRNLQLTRNLKEAMEMNGHLSRRISPEVGIASLEDKVFSSEEALVFAGGTKEMLEVKAGDFLYAEAKGNYVKVGYRSDSDKEKKITWRLLRATMKQAEEAVSACPFIIRCHRAFLVNIRMVVKVDGNSQGYKLNLEGCEEEVPVSRAYAKEVKALIENRTKS